MGRKTTGTDEPKPGMFTAPKEPRTRNKKEAMDALNNNPRTARLIAWGKHLAVVIALKKSTVHSREVRDAMAAKGLLNDSDKEFWIGPVFDALKKAKVLVWTGHHYKYSDTERNIHDREVKLWSLNEEADLTPFRTPPEETK